MLRTINLIYIDQNDDGLKQGTHDRLDLIERDLRSHLAGKTTEAGNLAMDFLKLMVICNEAGFQGFQSTVRPELIEKIDSSPTWCALD